MRLRPDLRVDRVEQLSRGSLASLGIDGLLLDLDETLLPASADRPSPDVVSWAQRVQADGLRLAIVSNGRPERVRRVAHDLGIPGRALTGKPWPGAFRAGLRDVGLPAERCAMAGDQVFTDLIGARFAGLRACLVTPLSDGGLPHTRLLRRIERRLFRGGDHGRPVHR